MIISGIAHSFAVRDGYLGKKRATLLLVECAMRPTAALDAELPRNESRVSSAKTLFLSRVRRAERAKNGKRALLIYDTSFSSAAVSARFSSPSRSSFTLRLSPSRAPVFFFPIVALFLRLPDFLPIAD